MDPIAVFFLFVLLILTVLFFARRYIAVLMYWFLHILFPLLALVLVSALFAPHLYLDLADRTLQAAGTYATIVNIDNGIDQIADIPEQIIDSLGGLFGGERNDEQVMLLQDNLYPGLVNLIAAIYRVGALLLATVSMILCVYINLNLGETMHVRRLEKRVKHLEHRLQIDEAQLLASANLSNPNSSSAS